MALKANIESVFQTLLHFGAPVAIEQLVEQLRAEGIHMNAERLRALPSRFPDNFRLVEPDHIEASLLPQRRPSSASARSDEADTFADDDGPDPAWWSIPAPIARLARSSVAVLDIETTGLDHDLHEIYQIAVVNLDNDNALVIDIDTPGNPQPDVPVVTLAEAITQLAEWLAPYEAVCGHGLRRFDLPFLADAADKAGVAWEPPSEVLDVHELSLLVDPTLEGRSLVELAHWLDIEHASPHVASADAAATKAVASTLLSRFDTSEPSFALAHRLMAEGGNPWARLITAGTVDAVLDDVLTAATDPLVSPASGMTVRSARAACDSGYDALSARAEYRDRPSQREMSDLVAEVFDEGGRVLIEAPTGTGKSLGYLIPAAGRAVTAPVVIATHTKVLQRQLRDDAVRLRDLGVLTAPFRQLQGVANYLCVREIAETLQLRQLTGTAWIAVAVAVRSLAMSPNGVWDDVTDGLTRRSSRTYAITRSALATTSGTCERSSCDWAEQCPMMQRLAGIDTMPGILATNHALVATWLADSEQTHAPAAMFDKLPTELVLDEAHNLEDSMASAWAGEVGAQSLNRLITWLWRGRGPIPQARQLAVRLGADPGVYQTLADYRKGLPELLSDLGTAVDVFLHEYGGPAATVTVMPFQRNWPEFRAVSAELVRAAAALGTLRSMLLAAAAQLADVLRSDPGLAQARYRRTTVAAARRRVDRLLSGAAADLEQTVMWLRFLADIAEPHLWVHVLSGGDCDVARHRGQTNPRDPSC